MWGCYIFVDGSSEGCSTCLGFSAGLLTAVNLLTLGGRPVVEGGVRERMVLETPDSRRQAARAGITEGEAARGKEFKPEAPKHTERAPKRF